MTILAVSAFASLLLASPANARNVIVVDGTGRAGAALLAPEIQPGDTVTYIDYPATVLWPSYDQSVAAGSQALREELADAPDDTLVVAYSQGARIAGDVLTEPQNAGVSGVLYSVLDDGVLSLGEFIACTECEPEWFGTDDQGGE
ncbi:PE-PPE domain-containing protein [Rhodococcus sp. T9N]|uniref:PE-PPE domain-containing protein n=1 Tax=Rhodococcus sp. T9N TaxID=627445 RepID=UPI0021C48DDD|nr:PE-PPE domain-containing protein [Rhodococcus sp. T9N]